MSEQKIALITGANKGLGFETARQLGRQNIKVLVGARDETRGQAATDKLRAEGCAAQFVLLDVSDAQTHEAAVKYVEENYGKLDILVNNAGIVLESMGAQPSDVSLETLRKTFDTASWHNS